MNVYKLQTFIDAVEEEKTVDLSITIRHFAELVEIARLADIINAEFKSDPMSVQCFDLRIVNGLDKALEKLDAIK